MLVNLRDYADILIEPFSGEAVEFLTSEKFCTKISRKPISCIAGIPVLIDFNSSIVSFIDICDCDKYSVPRKTSWTGRMLRNISSPPRLDRAQNISKIITSISSLGRLPIVLVVGGGSIGDGMEPFYENEHIHVLAFDIYASPHVQILADAHKIPFAADSFDLVIVQAVLEHVIEPVTVVAEINRVLRPGGIVYAETPFLQAVHEGAFDFTRFTDSGHRYLFREFDHLASGQIGGAGSAFLNAVEYFWATVFRSRRAGRVARLAFFWLKYVDLIALGSQSLDAAAGVYFWGRKGGQKIGPKDIVKYYKGAQR